MSRNEANLLPIQTGNESADIFNDGWGFRWEEDTVVVTILPPRSIFSLVIFSMLLANGIETLLRTQACSIICL